MYFPDLDVKAISSGFHVKFEGVIRVNVVYFDLQRQLGARWPPKQKLPLFHPPFSVAKGW